LPREKLTAKSSTLQRRNRVASRRYRDRPPCRKVVCLLRARVPYYARPRLTPPLSAHVSLRSGSIRCALADVSSSPSPPLLGIKLANGWKKWPRDNTLLFRRGVFTALSGTTHPPVVSSRQPLTTRPISMPPSH